MSELMTTVILILITVGVYAALLIIGIKLYKPKKDIFRANYLYTIERNGVRSNIVDWYSNPVIFLAIEKSLGYNTVILYYKELTPAEFNYIEKINYKI